MELDLAHINHMDDLTFYFVLFVSSLCVTTIACLIMSDESNTPPEYTLYSKVVELSSKIDELNDSMVYDSQDEFEELDSDEIPVFRFMDGSSFYIIDDDDEFVLVGPNMYPKRVVSIESIRARPVTRLHTGGGIVMYAQSVDRQRIRVTMTNFDDEFERDMFIEFIEENGFKFNKE
jgi:hypothetical protein